MNPQDAIDLSREAIMTCMMVGGPILVASLLSGLVVSVFQAMTQVQDQSVSFVPKVLMLLVLIGLCLPWLTDHMLDFAKQSFETPMTQWQNGDKSGFESQQELPSISPAFETSPSASKLPFNTASFKQPEPNRTINQMPSLNSGIQSPMQNPPIDAESTFILPHYRFSKVPKTDIDG